MDIRKIAQLHQAGKIVFQRDAEGAFFTRDKFDEEDGAKTTVRIDLPTLVYLEDVKAKTQDDLQALNRIINNYPA